MSGEHVQLNIWKEVGFAEEAARFREHPAEWRSFREKLRQRSAQQSHNQERKKEKMTPRTLSAAIDRAIKCHVYVSFSPHDRGDIWVEIPKGRAKGIVDLARNAGIREIDAYVENGHVFIGGPDEATAKRMIELARRGAHEENGQVYVVDPGSPANDATPGSAPWSPKCSES